jgi:hypothetical protein
MPDSQLTEEERKRLREVETRLAALGERTHSQNNKMASDAGLAQILSDLKAGMAKLEAKAEVPKASGDLPIWGKWLAACGTVVTIGTIVFALVWNVSSAGTAITARVTALEAWKAETVAIPTRVQALETNADTSRRIRDQQQQGTSDRLISLERADTDARDRLNAVLQSLATITAQLQAQAARTEELLRRQDRLENRLGARPGSGSMEEQPTSLRILPSRSTYPAALVATPAC